MRLIGIDFGERRIGVAAADDRMRMAIPLETVVVTGDPVDDLVRIVEDQHPDEVVIGLPLSLTGAEGPQALRIREVAGQLSERITIPVRFHDERFTTTEAELVAPPAKRGKPDNRDSIAASILLQSYMDSQRPYD
jgi:putative holliday junction resolvase